MTCLMVTHDYGNDKIMDEYPESRNKLPKSSYDMKSNGEEVKFSTNYSCFLLTIEDAHYLCRECGMKFTLINVGL